jgi:putative holliday junction resolvase
MKYLGIDFGKSKIGLAISDGVLAEPLKIIEFSNCELQIGKICQEEKIEKIIVGVSEGKSAERAKDFGFQIGKVTKLPVEYFDETLTTHDALVKMKEAKSKRQDEDAISAAIILQNYLDSQIYV